MAARVSEFGEAFVGSGPEAAHLNTVLGEKGGPTEVAWTTALATPREGHAAFVVVAQPNAPVRPMTLFVNKAMIASTQHATLTWGAAQLGVASGVLDAVAAGVIDPAWVDDLLLIAAVWVDPTAEDADAVYDNNRAATLEALRRGSTSDRSIDEIVALRDSPINGYYVPRSLRTT